MHNSKPDFRDVAVAESRRLLAVIERERGQRFPDPMLAGISCCVPASGDASGVRRRMKWTAIVGLVLGFAGLLSGAVIAGLARKNSPDEWVWLTLGCMGTLTGFAFMFGGIFLSRRLIGSHIAARLAADSQPPMERPIRVEVEESATRDKLKSVPEDAGYLEIHEDARCVLIEGLSHRYLIASEDLVLLVGEGSKHQRERVILAYRIGDVTLEMTLTPQDLTAEFRRQLYGGNSGLHRKLKACLDPASRTTAAPRP